MSIVPLADQAAEVAREVRARQRIYPGWIAKGRLTAATAETKLRDITAAAATLRLLVDHADGLRALLRFLRAADLQPGEDPSAEEREFLLGQPAVQAVLATFPDAVLIGITPTAPPSVSVEDHDNQEQGELL